MLLKKNNNKDDFYSMSSNNIYILQIVMLYDKNQLQVTILVPIDQVWILHLNIQKSRLILLYIYISKSQDK